MKKNALFFIIGFIIAGSIGTYAAAKISASDIFYTDKNAKEKRLSDVIDGFYERIANSNPASTAELSEMLELINANVTINDVLTTSFMDKVATSKTAAKKMLDNSTFRSNITSDLLSHLNMPLVSTLSSNTDVIYSSEYSNSWLAYYAFDTTGINNAWCTASGSTNGAYIGYKFATDVNVSVVSFYNGGKTTGESYPLKQAKLQYSSDGTNWNDASEVVTFSNVKQTSFLFNTLADGSYRYWRIYIVNAHSNYVEMSQLQFHGI